MPSDNHHHITTRKVDKSILEKEKQYAQALAFKSKADIKLLGYKTIYIKKEAIPEFNKFYFLNKQSVDAITRHAYDPETGQLRIYFPVRSAIVRVGKTELVASEDGSLSFAANEKPIQADLASMTVIGRIKTDKVTGTEKNIIEGDRILLTEPVKVQHFIGDDVAVFDFGERDVISHHGHHDDSNNGDAGTGQNTKSDSGDDGGEGEGEEEGESGAGIGEEKGTPTVPCLRNHGGPNCTIAFNISQGRCTFDPRACMDYNGPFTDCVNAGGGWARWRNFAGSDCAIAMAMGHCWNEVM